MIKSFKMNFQSQPEYKKENYKCLCGKADSQNHALVNCFLYKDLLEDHDTKSVEGLVDFFDAILKRRQDEEDRDELDEDAVLQRTQDEDDKDEFEEESQRP